MAQEPIPPQNRVLSALATAGCPLQAIDLLGGDDVRGRGGIMKTPKICGRNKSAVALQANNCHTVRSRPAGHHIGARPDAAAHG